MLNQITTPGLFVTGTDTGVGKTVVAAAIAKWFHRRGKRVGLCKIAATGCERQNGTLISSDSQILSQAIENTLPLELICPVRFEEPLAPAVAAERAGTQMDWLALQLSLNTLASKSDVMIVEGVGGIMVPMDASHTVLDVAIWLGLPTLVVARPGLGTINHTVLTVNALRLANVNVAGVVVNRFDPSSNDISQATNVDAIRRWGKVPVICTVEEGNEHAIDPINWNPIVGSR